MYGSGAGVVLGASTTATAAIVLPNTGSNRLLTVVATITLVTGLVILTTTVARLIAKRAYKA